MKTVLTSVMACCLLAATFSDSQAAPAIKGEFIADPGKTDSIYNMARCSKVKRLVYSHAIILYSDGSFLQQMDLDGVQPPSPDFVVTGTWAKPKPGRIELLYDGDITQGASGTGSWADVFAAAEAGLVEGCDDLGMKFIYPTVRVKKMTLEINGKGDRARLQVKVDGYAQGGSTRSRKASITVRAKGNFTGNP